MEKIFAEDIALQKQIGDCRVKTIHVTALPPDCTKKTISLFVDSVSEDEIALIVDSEKRDGTKSSVISRIRIGNTVYEREIL